MLDDLGIRPDALGDGRNPHPHVLQELESALSEHPLLVRKWVDSDVDLRQVLHFGYGPPRSGVDLQAGDGEARVSDHLDGDSLRALKITQDIVEQVEVRCGAVTPAPAHHHARRCVASLRGAIAVRVDGGRDVRDAGVLSTCDLCQVLRADHHMIGDPHELRDLSGTPEPTHERVRSGAVWELDQVVDVVDDRYARARDGPFDPGWADGNSLQM